MATQEKPKLSPLEEAFALLEKWKKTKSDNVKDQCVRKLFLTGYVIRPATMIIIHDEVRSDVLNDGNKEMTLYSRRTGLPVTPPNSTWQVAMANTQVGKAIFNRIMRRVLLGGPTAGCGSILKQDNGLYTIDNKLKEGKILVPDVPGDQLDTKLAELGIENTDWR